MLCIFRVWRRRRFRLFVRREVGSLSRRIRVHGGKGRLWDCLVCQVHARFHRCNLFFAHGRFPFLRGQRFGGCGANRPRRLPGRNQRLRGWFHETLAHALALAFDLVRYAFRNAFKRNVFFAFHRNVRWVFLSLRGERYFRRDARGVFSVPREFLAMQFQALLVPVVVGHDVFPGFRMESNDFASEVGVFGGPKNANATPHQGRKRIRRHLGEFFLVFFRTGSFHLAAHVSEPHGAFLFQRRAGQSGGVRSCCVLYVRDALRGGIRPGHSGSQGVARPHGAAFHGRAHRACRKNTD